MESTQAGLDGLIRFTEIDSLGTLALRSMPSLCTPPTALTLEYGLIQKSTRNRYPADSVATLYSHKTRHRDLFKVSHDNVESDEAKVQS